MFKQEIWKRNLFILFLISFLLYNSYNNSIKREGIQNNTKYSETEENLAYKNAAKTNNYYKNQCSTKKLDALQARLNTIADKLQSENEKSDMNNMNN